MTEFDDLQAEHQRLVGQRETSSNSEDFLRDIQTYIENVRVEAENITDPRERTQLRANLRYWASVVYDQMGIYPNTRLYMISLPSN